VLKLTNQRPTGQVARAGATNDKGVYSVLIGVPSGSVCRASYVSPGEALKRRRNMAVLCHRGESQESGPVSTQLGARFLEERVDGHDRGLSRVKSQLGHNGHKNLAKSREVLFGLPDVVDHQLAVCSEHGVVYVAFRLPAAYRLLDAAIYLVELFKGQLGGMEIYGDGHSAPPCRQSGEFCRQVPKAQSPGRLLCLLQFWRSKPSITNIAQVQGVGVPREAPVPLQARVTARRTASKLQERRERSVGAW
jgi:hypothetical protein